MSGFSGSTSNPYYYIKDDTVNIGYLSHEFTLNSYLEVTRSNMFYFAKNNFTVEFWIKTNQVQSIDTHILGTPELDGTLGKWVIFNNKLDMTVMTSSLQLVIDTNTGLYTIRGNDYSINDYMWHHICFTREGNTINGFHNGKLVSSVQVNPETIIGLPISDITVGYGKNGTSYFNGLISNLRVVNGRSIYTSSFTVPSVPLTNIRNTVMLTLQNNYVLDNSNNKMQIQTHNKTNKLSDNPFEGI